MTHRTVELSDFESLLASDFPPSSPELIEARELVIQERRARLAKFPYSVLLLVAFAEYDYANRWCWQEFGPSHGECLERQSDYPACSRTDTHSHEGNWMPYWHFKTDYNYGYSEWHFVRKADADRFLEFVPRINWGEAYSK